MSVGRNQLRKFGLLYLVPLLEHFTNLIIPSVLDGTGITTLYLYLI